jgi:hypothetical protein
MLLDEILHQGSVQQPILQQWYRRRRRSSSSSRLHTITLGVYPYRTSKGE